MESWDRRKLGRSRSDLMLPLTLVMGKTGLQDCLNQTRNSTLRANRASKYHTYQTPEAKVKLHPSISAEAGP